MDTISADIFFNFETTINHAEIVAIRTAFEQILKNINNIHKDFKSIVIFTDSLFCFNMFTGNSYPKLKIYYDELIEIFNHINLIKTKFDIKFVKVESHSEIEENDEVDKRAKNAAEQAIILQENNNYNGKTWEEHNTPAIVDIQKYISRIKEIHFDQQQREFEQIFDSLNNKQIEKENTKWKDYLLINALFDNDKKFIKNSGKLFKHELKLLTGKEIEIISKLRTEHISLFGYCKYILGLPNELCPICIVTETVQHFVMDCRNFEKERTEMRKELVKVDLQFNEENFFNIYNILFPHLWVPLPSPEEENYKELWNLATKKRAAILRIVTQFVQKSQRFHGQDII